MSNLDFSLSTKTFEKILARLDEVSTRLAAVEKKVASLELAWSMTAAAYRALDNRVVSLEVQIDNKQNRPGVIVTYDEPNIPEKIE